MSHAIIEGDAGARGRRVAGLAGRTFRCQELMHETSEVSNAHYVIPQQGIFVFRRA
jgi:hypothetical protein